MIFMWMVIKINTIAILLCSAWAGWCFGVGAFYLTEHDYFKAFAYLVCLCVSIVCTLTWVMRGMV